MRIYAAVKKSFFVCGDVNNNGIVNAVDVLYLDVSARLDSVLSVMVERHLDAVVITRSVSTGDKLAGIFTTTDACREFAATLARQYAIDGNSAA